MRETDKRNRISCKCFIEWNVRPTNPQSRRSLLFNIKIIVFVWDSSVISLSFRFGIHVYVALVIFFVLFSVEDDWFATTTFWLWMCKIVCMLVYSKRAVEQCFLSLHLKFPHVVDTQKPSLHLLHKM